jgi:hypothetical protein
MVMRLEIINNYVNPFSYEFSQTVKDFDDLSLSAKILTIALTVLATFVTAFLLGIGGCITFKVLVNAFKTNAVSANPMLEDYLEDFSDSGIVDPPEIIFNSKTNKFLTETIAPKFLTETIAPFRWDRDPFFKDETVDSMKEKLKSAKVTLINGMLSVEISLSNNTEAIDLKNNPSKSISNPVIPVNLISLEKEKGCVGFISILPTVTGYVGRADMRNLYPKNQTELMLEDGTPIPLDPCDFFVELEVLEMSQALVDVDFPRSFTLPAMILKNKHENDVIRLKYHNNLIELYIRQLKYSRSDVPDSFSKVLSQIETCVKKERDIECPYYSIEDRFWWYKLGKYGAIYKIKMNELESTENKKLRKILKPTMPSPRSFKLQNSVKILLDFGGLETKDIDIIFNQKYLIFYGKNLSP